MTNKRPLPHSQWRHYKSVGGSDHTYEVIGIAKHSETGEEMVVYRPLYTVPKDSWVYGYEFAVRPLAIWYDQVEWQGKKVQRFVEIV